LRFYFRFVCFFQIIVYNKSEASYLDRKNFNCGPYGFVCEGTYRVRLCDDEGLLGPSFKCPANTNCNEDSSDVCENTINYIEPGTRKILRCHKNERIPDPNVPQCKGYILCIPNQNRFQGIKFKCAGNTIFNGFTRTCSTPNKYRCPGTNTNPDLEINSNENRKIESGPNLNPTRDSRPIECKNYKFSVTDDASPVRAAYFCPSRPVNGENSIRCTVFSSKYCLTLEKENDVISHNTGLAYRKPRFVQT
jgi:hypothetical protein